MNLKDPQQRGEAISAYLDGELTPDELAAFERFLETSPEARAEVQQMRQVVQQVAGLPRSTAPPDMRAAIQKQIAPPPVVTNRFPFAYRMGLGLAAAIATVFVALRFTSDTVPPHAGVLPESEMAAVGEVGTPLEEAPAVAMADRDELARFADLGYVGAEEDDDDFEAMMQASGGAKPMPTAAAAPAPRVAAAPARALGYSAGRGGGTPISQAQLEVTVQTSNDAQFERLDDWATALRARSQQQADGTLLLQPATVAGMLDVLASEDTADSSFAMKFDGQQVEDLRTAFRGQPLSYVPEKPAAEPEPEPQPEVFAQRANLRKRTPIALGIEAMRGQRGLSQTPAIDPAARQAIQELFAIDLTDLTLVPRIMSAEPPMRVRLKIHRPPTATSQPAAKPN